MNFFLKNKNIVARLLLSIFVISMVAVPAGAAIAQADPNSIQMPVMVAHSNPAVQGGFEAAMAALDNDSPPDVGCTSGDNKIAGCTALLSYYLFIFTYWLAGWMSLFFNFSLNYFVMGMGALFREMDGIMIAWKTVRDVANVFLVFLTVYIGIATILGISGYGAKQLLWKVVLAALLVNFSVTFTKVVIDISNATAMQIYTLFEQRIAPGDDCSQRRVNPKDDNDPCVTRAIAGAFWSQLQITTLFDAKNLSDGLTAGSAAKPNAGEVYKKLIVIFLMGSMMFIVMAFVFGGAGILLLARFVILVFLLIVSPIALVMWITGVSSQGRVWWSKLLSQSFFPPAILLCWWLAYIILESYTNRIQGSLSEGVLATTSGISIVSMYVVVMGFLVAGLILASKMGAYGANAVIKTGKGWARTAVGTVAVGGVIGGAGYLGRQTVGRMAASRANNENLKDRAATGNWLQRKSAEAQIAASKRIASSSFDARSMTKSKLAGSAGGKGGHTAWAEKKVKKTEELNKHLSSYSGTAEEKSAHQGKLTDLDTRFALDIRKQEMDTDYATELAQREELSAIAKSKLDTANPEERLQAKVEYDYAQKRLADHKKEQADKIAALHAERDAQKQAVTAATALEFENKAKVRTDRNLDRLSTEKTLGVLPTPQWKKNAVAKIRKEGGKSELERKIEKALKEDKEGKTPPAPETPARETPAPTDE